MAMQFFGCNKRKSAYARAISQNQVMYLMMLRRERDPEYIRANLEECLHDIMTRLIIEDIFLHALGITFNK